MAVVCVATACQPAPTTAFSADFDGSSLDTQVWYPNRWFAADCAAGATSGEQEWYRPNVAQVADGNLVLTATAAPNNCAEGTWSGQEPFTSGWVQTGGSRSYAGVTKPGYVFQYGRIDVRFRASAGAGLWPAIWLLSPGDPSSSGTLPYPSRPEIDVVEIHGDQPDLWRFHVHSQTTAGAVDDGSEFKGPDTSTGFHVASVDWRSDQISWLVDGVTQWTYRGPGIPQEPMYIVMNLAVGGIAGTPAPDAFPATMLVDYVHVTP